MAKRDCERTRSEGKSGGREIARVHTLADLPVGQENN